MGFGPHQLAVVSDAADPLAEAGAAAVEAAAELLDPGVLAAGAALPAGELAGAGAAAADDAALPELLLPHAASVVNATTVPAIIATRSGERVLPVLRVRVFIIGCSTSTGWCGDGGRRSVGGDGRHVDDAQRSAGRTCAGCREDGSGAGGGPFRRRPATARNQPDRIPRRAMPSATISASTRYWIDCGAPDVTNS